MANQSKRYSFGLLLLVSTLLCVTFAVKQTQAVSPSPASREDQPIGTWKKVKNPGWSGDSHSWISATNGWSFTPQPPWGIEFYQWDGTEWKMIQTLDKNGLMYLLGIDIQMLSADDGWAVAPSINEHYSTFFHWNGAKWDSVQTITDTDIVSMDVFMHNAGWAVGISTCCGANYYSWNGNTWQKEDYIDQHWAVSDISMISDADGWSVGNGIARKMGDTWAAADSPTSESLNGIDMIGSSDGWIVGDNGTILHWDGSGKWTVVTSPTSNNLRDIEMLSTNDGWAVGDQGTILHWNGTKWALIASPTTADLREIDMTSSTDGWIPFYDDTTSSPGLLHYTVVPPSLTINHNTGASGSFFSVAGSDFPQGEEAAVTVNGQKVGSVPVNNDGTLSFILSTADADEGYYLATASVNPSATVQFVIDDGEPARTQEGSGPVINVPAGIAYTEQLFMPVVLK